MEIVEPVPKPAGRSPWALLLVSAVLQLVVGVPYLFAPILAPGGVVLVLWATWLALTIALFFGWRHHVGKSLLLVPLATFLLWFGILAAAQLVIGHWSV